MHATRKSIESEFTIENGIIKNPGKFENCPVYAPYFYEDMINGTWEYDDNHSCEFAAIEACDVEQFPELAGFNTVTISEDDNGFIYIYVE